MLTTLAGVTGIGVATLVLSVVPLSPLAGALGAIFAVGFMVPLANGPIQAVLQATVPPELQGRVFTLYGSLAGLAIPLGLVLAAPIAELAGVRAWYVVGGTVCVLAGIVGLFIPSLLRIESGDRDDRRPAAGVGTPTGEPV